MVEGEAVMWAKFTRVLLDPGRVDDAVAAVDRELLPAVLETPGAMEAYSMVERTRGIGIVVTCWADFGALENSRRTIGERRARVLDAVGARIADTAVYEVHGSAPPPPTGVPVCSRVTFVEGLAPDIGEADQTLFNAALARYGDLDGFLSLCWLVDGRSGNGLGITTWQTAGQLRASEQLNRRVRREVESTFGCRVDSVLDVETITSVRCPDPIDEVLDLREPTATLN